MAKTNKIVYVTQAQYDSLVSNGTVTVGGVTYTYDANNTYMVREDGLEGTSVQSTGASNGQVLTADGSGGASWQTAGGGSGDVVASGTLSVGAVILGLGNKTVSSSSGTNGKFLGWNGGATWRGLYQHLIYANQTGDSSTLGMSFCFEVISTQSEKYTALSSIPARRYLAMGHVDGSIWSLGHCSAMYFTKSGSATGGTVQFWKEDNSGTSSGSVKEASTTITDEVKQIL